MAIDLVEFSADLGDPAARQALDFLSQEILGHPASPYTVQYFANNSPAIWGWVDEGQLIGAAGITHANDPDIELSFFAVHPARRGEGLGGVFLRELELRLAARNVGSIVLSPFGSSWSFFEHRGYVADSLDDDMLIKYLGARPE